LKRQMVRTQPKARTGCQGVDCAREKKKLKVWGPDGVEDPWTRDDTSFGKGVGSALRKKSGGRKTV